MKISRFHLILGSVVGVALAANVVLWQQDRHWLKDMIQVITLLSSPNFGLPEYKNYRNDEPCKDGPDIAECEYEKSEWRLLNDENDPEGLALLTSAANRGYADAQEELGYKFLLGQGVPRDPKKAVELLEGAANQGSVTSQAFLARLYEEGRAVKLDYAESLNWYRLAADQGDDDSMTSLGDLLRQGKGAPKNPVEAVNWYGRAAELGNTDAMDRLSEMNFAGEGLERNQVTGLFWLFCRLELFKTTSTDARYKEIMDQDFSKEQKKIALLSGAMSEQDVAAARRRADAWIAAHPKLLKYR